MELMSAWTFLSGCHLKSKKSFSCGGARCLLFVLLWATLLQSTAKVEWASVFLRDKVVCVCVCVCVCSALCALLTHRQCPLLSLLSLLIPIDVFHFARAQLQVGDVKNIASRNGSLLIMQIGAPLMGIFCFRNYIPLSQVRLHLSNFTGIVTKIWKWVSFMPVLILSRSKNRHVYFSNNKKKIIKLFKWGRLLLVVVVWTCE